MHLKVSFTECSWLKIWYALFAKCKHVINMNEYLRQRLCMPLCVRVFIQQPAMMSNVASKTQLFLLVAY